MSFPALCATAGTCPWINAGTASGVLGGVVNATVTHSQKSENDATCDFTGHRGPVAYELHVDVETMTSPRSEFAAYAAKCKSGSTALKAIGTEAIICTIDAKPGQLSEGVVGRVRNQAFIIRIGTSNPSETRASIEDKARRVAEQVAGNLF